MNQQWDVIIIGAGAAGMMCAAQAAYRGRRVLLLDNAKQAGRKILISGGGRCNFTNINARPDAYICRNPHFVKSALKRFSANDFIELVERHGLHYHEKTLGQLFCDESAKDLLAILRTELEWSGAQLVLRTEITDISYKDETFTVHTSAAPHYCQSLVIATGGLSMPKLGATPFGYKIAEQFDINVLPTRAGLVPFTLHDADKARFANLAGVSLSCEVSCETGQTFRESLLFTHRGLSGPAMLQISNYWLPGEWLSINLLPDMDANEWLKTQASARPRQKLATLLTEWLPKRFVDAWLAEQQYSAEVIGQLPAAERNQIAANLHHWPLKPNGTEGYRTAEVTLGGVDTDELSSKTMESKKVPGLYFIGEVVDVTGWLGGYNFQWAWSSGWAAGQAV